MVYMMQVLKSLLQMYKVYMMQVLNHSIRCMVNDVSVYGANANAFLRVYNVYFR